jgi:chemotaxis protein methyltransferase CheR
MSTCFVARDVERFRDVVTRRLGLQFEGMRLGQLGDTLRRRVNARGQSCAEYLQQLESAPANDEWHVLVQELTIAETYFFRNINQFRAVSEVALPERMLARSALHRLRILSAGCASGDEAYSLAILVRETVPSPAWSVSILAVDLNPAVLEKARRGQFSAWALRETPEHVQARWFRAEGGKFALDDSVRAAVEFDERNLAHEDSTLWQPETFDLIFCRNVLMYLTPETARAVVHRMARALAPGGYLFLGHAETLRGLSLDFHLRHTHDTFYYQRKDAFEPAPPVVTRKSTRPQSAAASQAAVVVDTLDTGTWVDTIRRASDRIQVLAEAHQPVSVASPSVTAPIRDRRRLDLDRPLELLQHERFAEALDLVDALPLGAAHDPEVLLLQAVLCAHSGRLDVAEETCRRLLAADELEAGAHYVLALCREGVGDVATAATHDRIATYLDPSFAMPRLHLGLIARRAGDAPAARRELQQALMLLRHEDASHVLFFGGGFGREALIALCRAELRAVGGNA